MYVFDLYSDCSVCGLGSISMVIQTVVCVVLVRVQVLFCVFWFVFKLRFVRFDT